MNYNQKRRINQVGEGTLIVGVDIAKSKNVARAQNFRGVEYGHAIKFVNREFDFERFKRWMSDIKADTNKDEIIIGLEPTGHYWLNFFKYMIASGYKVVTVNPHHVKKSKELDDNNPTKCDKKDARVIAQLLKDGRYSEPNLPQGVYADLRVAMNHRRRLNKDFSRVKNQIIKWLDMYFPEFNDVFNSFEGKAALSTLKHFPLSSQVYEKTPQEIVNTWREDGIKRGVGLKKARKLLKAAESSVGLVAGTQMALEEIKHLLERYHLIKSQLSGLKEKIEKFLEEIPGAQKMLTVPGIGSLTVAGFYSECGKLTDYEHPKQIIKLAGLNLKEHSSGKHKGETTITKRGRPNLRALLFRASIPLVRHNDEFRQIHNYYTTRPKNPLAKKQSLIAICCKLIKILFALGTKEVEYDGDKLLNDIERPGEYRKTA